MKPAVADSSDIRRYTVEDLRRMQPIMARHEGVWEGVYRRYDALGKPIGEHRCSSSHPTKFSMAHYREWTNTGGGDQRIPNCLRGAQAVPRHLVEPESITAIDSRGV